MLPPGNGPEGNRTWDDFLGTLDSRNLDTNANAPQGVNPYTLSTPVRSNINFTYRCPLDMQRKIYTNLYLSRQLNIQRL